MKKEFRAQNVKYRYYIKKNLKSIVAQSHEIDVSLTKFVREYDSLSTKLMRRERLVKNDRCHLLLIELSEKMREKISDKIDRKSTRLNSSHVAISYAVCCLKKK